MLVEESIKSAISSIKTNRVRSFLTALAIIIGTAAVIFATLYVFGLIGLLIGILSDLMYVWIDPRIDFESREN